jgi:uncharacterized protein (DUF2141 family)
MTGFIVDEHGEPLQNITVKALLVQRSPDTLAATQVAVERETDDRGRYRIGGLASGRYIIAASADAALSRTAERDTVGYAPVYYPGTAAIGEAVPVELNGDATGVDMVFAPSPVTLIRGLALDNDGPLIAGSARLTVSRRSSAVSVQPQFAEIGSDGRFQFADVPPGEYIVQVLGSGPGRTGLFGLDRIRVDRGNTSLTVSTSHGATLEGRFVVEGEMDPAACARLLRPGVSTSSSCEAVSGTPFIIAAAAVDPDSSRPESNSSSFVVSGDGTFYVTSLFGETAFVMRRSPADSWYLKSVVISGQDVTERGFDFGAGPRTIDGAEIVISRSGATISGRVNSGATETNSFGVVVFPVFRDQWVPHSPRLKFTRSTDDGAFRVTGLPPGDYYVAAVDRIDGTAQAGEWQSADVLTQLVSSAERVSTAERESRVVTPRLIRR